MTAERKEDILRYGFSLLELLITLSIVFVLLMATVPELKNFFNQSKNQVISDQLLRAIHLARSEAISRGQAVTLCASSDGKHCQDDWLKGYILQTINNNVLYFFSNPKMAGTLHWRVFNGKENNVLRFFPTGSTDFENGTFWYCDQATHTAQWAIAIIQSGRTRKFYPDQGELSC
jgi:type IV fimbrial biogenesis protein FimT